MFADLALATRIEGVEVHAMRAIALAAQKSGTAPSAFARELDGGVAVFIRPGSPINKVIGIGLGSSFDERSLREVELQYHKLGEPVRVELSTLADPEVGRRLTERGYRLNGFENVLACRLDQNFKASSGAIQAGPIDESQEKEWFQVLVSGFSHSDETGVTVDDFTRGVLDQVMKDMMFTPGYDRYLARMGNAVVGAASLRMNSDLALLSGAATLSEYRRQGVQSALLARRLADAAQKGAEMAIITTAPGSRSQANAVRNGFTLLYSRAVLVLEN